MKSSKALQFASKVLKADRNIVLAAVAQDGRALEYASEELKRDREVVLAAVAQDGRSLENSHETLKGDIAFQQFSKLPEPNRENFFLHMCKVRLEFVRSFKKLIPFDTLKK